MRGIRTRLTALTFGLLALAAFAAPSHAASSFELLGTLGGPTSEAYAISADGSTVVGTADPIVGDPRAFRWVNGLMTDLGPGAATGVSADGSVIVGGTGPAFLGGEPGASRAVPA